MIINISFEGITRNVTVDDTPETSINITTNVQATIKI